jgi:rhamnulokinase
MSWVLTSSSTADIRSGDGVNTRGRPAATTLMSIDLGSSSVKLLTAELTEDGVSHRSLRRLPHRPYWRRGVLQWGVEDFVLDLVREESWRAAGRELLVSIDAWGSDIAFLDRSGQRIGPLRSYRDSSLARGFAQVVRRGMDEFVASRTGCAVAQGSTLSQLFAWNADRPDWLADVCTVLPLADYLGARLTGHPIAGVSAMSTTGFLDPVSGTVDRELLDAVGVRESWFLDPMIEGMDAGELVIDGLAPTCRARLVKVAGHDTASALRSGYGSSTGRIFASIGSWAVVGTVCDDATRARAPFRVLPGVMHELTGDGRLRVNWNLPGMRIVQALEHEWFGGPAPEAVRENWIAGLGDWEDDDVLDVIKLDTQPSSAIDEWIECEGRMRHIRVSTRAERYEQALRSVAQGIADAVAVFAGAGLVSDAPVWACGGGTAVRPLIQWVSELTGRPVDSGPMEASAEGGLRGAAEVRAERHGSAEAGRPL